MTIREFLNACLNEWKLVNIMEYDGDINTIGADLDEDYISSGEYDDMRKIPDNLKNRKVEYFSIDNEIITIFMEE